MDVKLVMFKADGQRKDFSVSHEVTIIGRGETCDLRVPLLNVSRRHCELTLAGDGLTVKDLDSTNGTYVNNNRADESGLKAGDRLIIGSVVFTVQINGKPEQIEPVKASPTSADKQETNEEVVDLEAVGETDDQEIAASLSDLAEEDQDEKDQQKQD